MPIIRRILSLASASRSGRATGAAPAGRRGLSRRRAQPQPKATGLAALRNLLRR